MDAAALVTPYNHISFKRRKNTWYTIASGNWSDPNIWMSNSHRRYASPQNGDDVSIGLGHTVTFDVANNVVTTLNNFYVYGSFLLNSLSVGRVINVTGDLQANGTVDLTSTQALSVNLHGVNNYINNFICGANSTIAYTRNGDQPVMPLTYRHLQIANQVGYSGLSGVPYLAGTKYITANLNVLGNLNTGNYQGNTNFFVNLELGNYDLFVGGTTTITTSAQVMTVGQGAGLIKSGSGNITFVGLVTFFGSMIFTGNPVVEFRGGLTVNNNNATGAFNTGTNQFNFTTASQTATFTTGTYQFTCPVSVVGAIDLTVAASSGVMSLNQPIDTTVSGRQVINKGTIYFNSTSSLPSFTTGTFDRTSFANTVGYTMGASITLPYTSYSSLLVANSGTKTASGNTTISGNLTLNNSLVVATPTMEMGAFNLIVTGTTQLATTNGNATLSKTGAGSVLFTGSVTVQNSNLTGINFTGNPTVEVRGGMAFTNNSAGLNFGSGQYTFSTNSQSITATGVCSIVFPSALISGAITLTTNGAATTSTIGFATNPNGTVTGSILKNQGWIELFELPTDPIMATGQFDTTTVSTNGIAYSYSGDYVLPMTTYGGLYLKGTGTKTVSTSMTLNSVLIVGARSVFELGTSNLSVASTTTIELLQNTSIADYYSGLLKKSGAGSILFGGNLNLGNANNDLSVASLDFSGGNPAVELRGGITSVNTALSRVKTGTGAWTFSTNNQTLGLTGNNAFAFDSNIIISGAITLTASSTNAITFKGTVNGNNAASTFDNRGIVNYQATQQPMLVGILQTNAAANTFIYNAAGNQNVTGGTYRILTLAGSGVKTLQGNTVVVTTYTLTPPATLNLNGFTRS